MPIYSYAPALLHPHVFSQDSQRGVLLSVLNSIAQHELREALSLYFLLRAKGGASGRGAGRRTGEAGGGGGGGGGGSGGGGSGGSGGGVTASEAEQLCADFLERELGTRVQVRASEALQRLHRLGLVRVDGGPPASSAASSATSGGRPPSYGRPTPSHGLTVPLGLQCYTAVPMADALEVLRRTWGEAGRSSGLSTARGATQPPSLLQLTAAPSSPRTRMHRSISDADPGSPTLSYTPGVLVP